MSLATFVVGPMFSGKSGKLTDLLNREFYAGRTAICIHPKKDLRKFYYHSGERERNYDYLHLKDGLELTEVLKDKLSHYDIVAFEEVQFFNLPNLLSVVDFLLINKKKFFFAGLNLDSEGQPWDVTAYLLPRCDIILKLNAVCVDCGSDVANFSWASRDKFNKIEVGGKDKYKALCRDCFYDKRGVLNG
ncbi:MAG: hypothetical protein GF311_28405 [Candidatus Lokiarchaeota archaeon]|nr:hypothetical protein [Candidatus Lokiarchaeota archaeon]